MGLNISKGNMYPWISHTFNTIKGKCPHGCTYCYMCRWGEQTPLRFDELELKTNLGEGNFIFVGSSCDMFADKIPEEWIERTLEYCNRFDDNKYLFQTKNPKRILDHEGYFPYSTFCTTIETNRIYKEMGITPTPQQRSSDMGELRSLGGACYVTIEPIMDFDIKEMVELIKWFSPIQVNIGADSGNNNLPEPSKEKILSLITELKKFTIIDQKRNLERLLRD